MSSVPPRCVLSAYEPPLTHSSVAPSLAKLLEPKRQKFICSHGAPAHEVDWRVYGHYWHNADLEKPTSRGLLTDPEPTNRPEALRSDSCQKETKGSGSEASPHRQLQLVARIGAEAGLGVDPEV